MDVALQLRYCRYEVVIIRVFIVKLVAQYLLTLLKLLNILLDFGHRAPHVPQLRTLLSQLLSNILFQQMVDVNHQRKCFRFCVMQLFLRLHNLLLHLCY